MISSFSFVILPLCLAREVTFPPVSGFARDNYQIPLDGSIQSDIDISIGSAFSGLTTFANLPYVNCLSSDEDVEKYDIAFLGAPFDTVGHELFENRLSNFNPAEPFSFCL